MKDYLSTSHSFVHWHLLLVLEGQTKGIAHQYATLVFILSGQRRYLLKIKHQSYIAFLSFTVCGCG